MGVTKQLLEKLVKVAPFQGLTAGEAATFFEGAAEASAKLGDVIFKEGDPGDALYVVLNGEVAVTKKGVVLATLTGQAVLGEMTLLGTNEPRTATATAATDVALLTIPTKRVQALLKADNVAALKVVANLATVMSKRLSLINDKLVEQMGGGKRKEELADFSRILNRWSF